MSTVLALGDAHELDGFALVGARVVRASTPQEVAAAWRDLEPDVGLVVLTAEAAQTLRDELDRRPDVLTAVLP
jgi:vacuolar-type H+-ATPase subunit F/Vma7